MTNKDLWGCNYPIIIGVAGGKSIFFTIEEIVRTNDVDGLADLLKENKDLGTSGMLNEYFLKAANLGYVKMCDVFLEENGLNVNYLLAGDLNKNGREIVKNILGFGDEYLDILLNECYKKRKFERENILNKFKEKFLLNNVIENKNTLDMKYNKI